MGVFEIILIGIATVVMATFARILGEDAKTFIPRISKKMIEKAANKLSAKCSDRYEEEWLADLNDRPEMTAKFYHALSIYLWGARRVGKVVGFNQLELFYARYGKRMFDFTMASLALILLLPLIVVIIILIKLEDWSTGNKGSVFVTTKTFWPTSKPFQLIRFRTIGSSTNNRVKITRIGKSLRKSTIEHLPNLINVIIGYMTFVEKRHNNLVVKDGHATKAREKFRFPNGKLGLINNRMDDRVDLLQQSDVDGKDGRLSLWSGIKIILKIVFLSNDK